MTAASALKAAAAALESARLHPDLVARFRSESRAAERQEAERDARRSMLLEMGRWVDVDGFCDDEE